MCAKGEVDVVSGTTTTGPVDDEHRAIVYIVIWTLFVSLCCSIYPALRAAAADPVEAIRDE